MPPEKADYYTILGVLRDASSEDIRRAYFAAARRYHPDKNLLPGETEVFLQIQQAYEVLSNSERRARYNATLPKEEMAAGPIDWTVQYSRPNLVRLNEPQLIYCLLEVGAAEARSNLPVVPLNLSLVLDRSTSMLGEKIDVAKAASICILQMLRPEDLFSFIVFSDRAEVLLPSSVHHDPRSAQSRIQSIRTMGATEIYRGLEAGLGEVRKGLGTNHSNHLILITDGQTYGDEQACLQLAEESAGLGISISGFGIGSDWNDIFLDALVAKTGSNSTYISDPQDIQHVLVEKFNTIARVLVEDAVLEFKYFNGVQLRYCFRLQPEGGPVNLGEAMPLGPILQGTQLVVLLEFVVDPQAAQGKSVSLLEGTLKLRVASRPIPLPPIRLQMELPVAATASEELPPQPIVSALSRLVLYRLQERARQEAEAGEFGSATRHLRHLALQLQAQGHDNLSKTALLEAENIDKLSRLSGEGSKEMKYGTRSLLLPVLEKPS